MKLQKLLFITLLAVGLLPLLVFTTLNFPKILFKLKQSGEERQLLALQQDFRELNNLLERRRESLRNLSYIPGVFDLVTPSQSDVPYSMIRERLSGLLIQWCDAKKDITGITIMDSNGQVRLSLSRGPDGHLRLEPGNEQTFQEHDQVFLERTEHKPSTTYSAGLHLHYPTEQKRKIPHTHLAVTIGYPPDDARGTAYMHINLQNFLDNYPDYFLMRGDGAYIRKPRSRDINSSPDPDEAMEDFKDLAPLLDDPQPAVRQHHSLGNMALLPLLVNDKPRHSLWVGHEIARKDIKTWLKSYLSVFIAILLGMILLIVYIAKIISGRIDLFVKELTTGLTSLLEGNSPVRFSWRGPYEVQKLGKDLTRLAERYQTSNLAREKVEKELQEVGRQQEMILSSAAEGILGIDNEGLIIFANRSAESMFGYGRGELLYKNAHDTLHYQKPDGTRYDKKNCPFCQALGRRNPTLSTEDIFWLRGGTSIDVEYTASPLRDELDRPLGAVMCIQDITSRKKQDREMEKLQQQLLQAQKLEAIGTLAGGVAHDFNNLLTVINANNEILSLHIKKQDELYQHVAEIGTAAEKAANLTRQLLSFGRRETVQFKPVDLNNLIQGLEKMARRLIGEDIELEFNPDSRIQKIQADPGQIEQVFLNIIVNARDAMPEGGRITVATSLVNIDETSRSALPEAVTGIFALLMVSDCGTGMTREEQARIFDPFFTTKPAGRGTGLGLSVVYGIIQQHGGWINVYSEPDKGTTFKIYLPVSESEEKEGMAAIVKEAEIAPGNHEKILLVEDEDQLRYVASVLLSREGYTVKEASTIKEALDIFREEGRDIQLLISDVVLPDGYGPDLADKILEQIPDLPTIICSGYADDKARWPRIKEKDLPFLQKPFTRHELLKTVKSALSDK